MDFKTAPWPQISSAAKQIVQWLLTVGRDQAAVGRAGPAGQPPGPWQRALCLQLRPATGAPGDRTEGPPKAALVLCSRRPALQHPWLAQQGLAPDKPLDSVVLTRMAKFAAMNKLKKAALLVAAKSLSEAEITGLSNLFKSIDTDGSGTITVDEMRQACAKMGSHFQVGAALCAAPGGWRSSAGHACQLHACRLQWQGGLALAMASRLPLPAGQ